MIFLKRYKKYTTKFRCSKYRCYKTDITRINQSIYFDITFYYTGKITVAIPYFEVTLCYIKYSLQTIVSVLCMKYNDTNKYKQIDFRLNYEGNSIDVTATRNRKLNNIRINAKKYDLTYLSKLSNLIFKPTFKYTLK